MGNDKNGANLASHYKAKEFFSIWLDMQRPDLQKSLADYTKGESLFHVSNNGSIRRFFPKIPQQTKPGEDQTIARICTSNRILDAMVGMLDTSALDRLMVNKGLLTIYHFNPLISVRPTKRALPNNTNLNERWIVGYDPTYRDYESEVSGKILVSDAHADGDVLVVEGYLHTYIDSLIYKDQVIKAGTTKYFWICAEISETGIVTHKVEIKDANESWQTIKQGL